MSDIEDEKNVSWVRIPDRGCYFVSINTFLYWVKKEIVPSHTGYGYYAKVNAMSDVKICISDLSSKPAWATHVVWYS